METKIDKSTPKEEILEALEKTRIELVDKCFMAINKLVERLRKYNKVTGYYPKLDSISIVSVTDHVIKIKYETKNKEKEQTISISQDERIDVIGGIIYYIKIISSALNIYNDPYYDYLKAEKLIREIDQITSV